MADALHFAETRRLLAEVQAAWSGPGVPVTRASAGLTISTAGRLSRTEWRAVTGSRTMRAILGRIMRNGAARLLRRVQDASKPTYIPGLFLSGWRIVRDESSDIAFPDRLTLENPVPYASYVHRKGTPRRATVVRVYVRPLVAQMRDELAEDLARADVTQAIQHLVMG